MVSIPSELIESLRHAKHVVATTGAGVSAESGVPTFRDAQTGLWAKYEPTELAAPRAFHKDPKLVWEWYQWRRDKVLSVHPNPGHYALVELGSRWPKFDLITQNVDGLHQQAGSQNVIELHGSIMTARCFDRGHQSEFWPESSEQCPPVCEICASLMRPNVVWFNESLPKRAIDEAMRASRECDVFFSIGTSSIVYPAAALATNALESGAVVIEINPNETPLTSMATYSIVGPSGIVLPELLAKLAGEFR